MEGGHLEGLNAPVEFVDENDMCRFNFWDNKGDPFKAGNVRSVLKHHRELTGTIHKLLTRAKNGTFNIDTSLDDLATAKSQIDGIDQYLRAFIQPRYYAEYRPPHATAPAQKAFDIPEIFEMILEYLHMKELLKIQLVNKQFQTAVDSSDRLQRRLFFQTHPAPRRILTFGWEMYGFHCHEIFPPFPVVDELNITLPSQDHVGINAVFGPHMPTRIGNRCHRMLICQPVVRQMNVYTDCCLAKHPLGRRHRRSQPPLLPLAQTELCTITNDDGLTVGDLYDVAKNLVEEHRRCPHAEASAHDRKTGEVRVRVIFQTSIEVPPEDPLRKQKKERLDWEERNMLADQKHKMQKSRMRGFVAAKQAGEYCVSQRRERTCADGYVAHAAGNPIPTLEEFDAMNR